MKNYKNITVVSVYGHSDGESSLHAIQKSCKCLPGSVGLLLSIKRPPLLPPNIEWVEIPPLDYEQYSRFIIYSLASFIFTDYCLIVQDDGFAVSSENWSNEFLQYDFIGAPSPVAAQEKYLTVGFDWIKSPDLSTIVFNGGFSLRSKKILNIVRDSGLITKVFNEQLLNNEDVQMQVILRKELERRGINFAPLSIAKYFSLEYFHPSLHTSSDFKKVFGVHKKFMKLTGPLEVSYDAEGLNTTGENEFLEGIKSLGFTVKKI
jgi:hypothetical protein